MDFQEAIEYAALGYGTVMRKIHHFPRGGYHFVEWSSWLRIRLENDNTDFDALLFFETNEYDEEEKKWVNEWREDQISRADILAGDWETEYTPCTCCSGSGEVDNDDPDGHTLECWACDGTGEAKDGKV